jgi:hypothetical protein
LAPQPEPPRNRESQTLRTATRWKKNLVSLQQPLQCCLIRKTSNPNILQKVIGNQKSVNFRVAESYAGIGGEVHFGCKMFGSAGIGISQTVSPGRLYDRGFRVTCPQMSSDVRFFERQQRRVRISDIRLEWGRKGDVEGAAQVESCSAALFDVTGSDSGPVKRICRPVSDQGRSPRPKARFAHRERLPNAPGATVPPCVAPLRWPSPSAVDRRARSQARQGALRRWLEARAGASSIS